MKVNIPKQTRIQPNAKNTHSVIHRNLKNTILN
jgi:hypothetical protein